MPVDPRIALGYQPPQIASPLETAGQYLQLQNLMQRNRWFQTQEQVQRENQQRLARMNQEADALSSALTSDPNLDINQAIRVAPNLAPKLFDAISSARESNWKEQEKQLEFRQKSLGRAAQLLSTAADQESYSAALQQIVDENLLPPPILATLPTRFDPAAADRISAATTSYVDRERLKMQQDKANWEKTQREFEQRLNAARAQSAELALQAQQRTMPDESGLTPYQRQQVEAQQQRLKNEEQRIKLQQQRVQAAIAAARSGAPVKQDIVKDIADGIESGNIPPVLTRLYSLSGPVLAELNRRGFNLAEKQLDYNSLQQFYKTLNQSKIVQQRQALDYVFVHLKQVENLYDNLRSAIPETKFPVINRAAIVAAKNGLLGENAQKYAATLEAHIADLASELGQVYRAGGTPTDHTLELAEKMFKSEWPTATFKYQLEQLKQNIAMRKAALHSLQPALPGQSAPHDAPAGQPAGQPSVITDKDTIRQMLGLK